MTLDAWRDELNAALAMAGHHLSLYQLTIEPGTAFATAYARGDFRLPDEETQGALYETTQGSSPRPARRLTRFPIMRGRGECRHNPPIGATGLCRHRSGAHGR